MPDDINPRFARMAEMAELARAGYAGEPAPTGWTTIRPADLIGLHAQTGTTYYVSGEAAARVMRNTATGELVVSIRGTDSVSDWLDYPRALVPAGYDQTFVPLVAALRETFGVSTSITYVGHSLGGAAVHQLALRFGTSDRYFSFESPLIQADALVQSFGFDNDWVYNGPHATNGNDARRTFIANDFASFAPSLSETSGTHSIRYAENALHRLAQSAMATNLALERETVVFNCSKVLDLSAASRSAYLTGSLSGKVFVFGMDTAFRVQGAGYDYRFNDIHDIITGTNHGAISDWIDGMAGNDSLYGLNGNDRLFGGAGKDSLTGGQGFDHLYGGEGNDTLSDLNDGAIDALFGGNGDDRLFGFDFRESFLFGGAGKDTLVGGGAQDTYLWSPGDADVVRDNRENTVYFACVPLDLDSIVLRDSQIDVSKVVATSTVTEAFTISNALTAYGNSFTHIDLGTRALVDIAFSSSAETVTVDVGNSGSRVSIRSAGGVSSLTVFGGDGLDRAIVGQTMIDRVMVDFMKGLSTSGTFMVPVLYFHDFEQVSVNTSLPEFFGNAPRNPAYNGTFFINDLTDTLQYRNEFGNDLNVCRFQSYDSDIAFI